MKVLLLKWWLFLCVQALVFFTAYKFNFFNELLEKDPTKLSFFILFILVLATFLIGCKIFLYTRRGVGKKEHALNDINAYWFTGEACLALGLVGTVLGFIIMLGSTFGGLDVSDTTSMQNALVKMSIGMSTALYTTLVGLLSSLSIKVQLINFERAIQKS
jgi:hypothetical protein